MLSLLACVLYLAGWSTPAEAQTLLDRYREARSRYVAERIMEDEEGGVRPMPLTWHATPSDSLRLAPPAPPKPMGEIETLSFPVEDVHVVPKLAREWFQTKFEDVSWSFLGAGHHYTPFDTTHTRELRARLEAQFGAPTQTLGDFDLRKRRSEYVQFEYWLVVNDSIPVVVMDAGGPYDRGIIMSSDQRYRNEMLSLRRAVLQAVIASDERAPYVDYFFDEEDGRWYRTGFDGEDYFVERVPRYRLVPGRRPWLDRTRIKEPTPTDESATDQSPSSGDAATDGNNSSSRRDTRRPAP